MKNHTKLLAVAAVAVAALWAPAAVLADMAAAEIVDPSGSVIGMVTFEQTPTGVLMYVEVAGLPPRRPRHPSARGRRLHA